jgi:hypothetical protein
MPVMVDPKIFLSVSSGNTLPTDPRPIMQLSCDLLQRFNQEKGFLCRYPAEDCKSRFHIHFTHGLDGDTG